MQFLAGMMMFSVGVASNQLGCQETMTGSKHANRSNLNILSTVLLTTMCTFLQQHIRFFGS
jgi:hypothetical protein